MTAASQIAFSPGDVDECAAVLGQTERSGQNVFFVGGGTQPGLGPEPMQLDAIVRSERMTRIVEYMPSDMVIVAEAGVTLEKIQAVAREKRQMLAIDPPHPKQATIGGLVATGSFGPRRARYGAIRDLIIGVTLVRADGVVAHGGGKVVKNVAGFDLPKLACGSLGTLGMIATATFRLHPLPEASVTVRFDSLAPDRVFALVKSAREAQLEPSSAVAMRNGDGTYDLGFRFEGFSKGVEQQSERLRALGRGERDDGAFWSRHDQARESGSLRVKIASLSSRFAAVDSLLAPLFAAMSGASFAWYASLGIGFASGTIDDPAAAIEALRTARADLVSSGGSLVLEAAPAEVRAAVDPWGPPSSSFPIMEQLKLRFDPQQRLNHGRFIGGL